MRFKKEYLHDIDQWHHDYPEDLDRLREWAIQQGRRWRHELRMIWMGGHDWDCGWMRRLRNIVGPSGIDHIKIALPRKVTAPHHSRCQWGSLHAKAALEG